MTYNESRMPAWQRALSDRVAVDLVLAWGVALTVFLLVAVDAPSAFRLAIAGPALLVLPGYVVVATLYPRRGPDATEGRGSLLGGPDRITVRERFALAFGLSLALLPLLGIAISVSPWGFSESAVARAFTAFVVLGGLLAAIVRRRLPADERFRLSLDRWIGETRAALAGGTATDRALNWLVIGSIVVALLAAGGVLAFPQSGQSFTNFAVLGQGDDGELVAAGYPDELDANESATLVTAVENHEGDAVEYTVVVTMERVAGGNASGTADARNASGAAGDSDGGPSAGGGNASGTVGGNGTTGDGNAIVATAANVTESVELQRYDATVAAGQRWTHRHAVEPALSGSRLRVHYYLYRGDAPAAPDASSAYRHLYFWLTANDGAS